MIGAADGDCFVIVNEWGGVWTGRVWSSRRIDALVFRDGTDPAGEAEKERRRLRAAGETAHVVYIPPDTFRPFFGIEPTL